MHADTKRVELSNSLSPSQRSLELQWPYSFVTVAILAQGTSRAVAVTQAFFGDAGSVPGEHASDIRTDIQKGRKGEE